MAAHPIYPPLVAAQYAPVPSALAATDSPESWRAGLNLGLLAFAAMYLCMLNWDIASDKAPAVIGNTQNYYRMLLVGLAGCLSAFVLLRNPKAWGFAFPGPVLLLLLYGVTALTSSVFIPEHAFYSMWKSLEVIVVVLSVAAVLSYPDSQAAARSVYTLIIALNTCLLVVFAIEAVALSELAFKPARGYLRIQLRGVLPSTAHNALAFLAAVTAFATWCRLQRPARLLHKALYALLFALALAVLVLAQSRTSFIGFLIALLVYLVFARRFLLLALLAGAVLLAGSYASLSEVSTEYLLRGQDPNLVRSLSGRTQGWERAWEAFQEAPLLGHGFMAYARAHILAESGMSSMHGAFFEVIVGTGAVGLLLWAGAIVWTLMRLYFLPRKAGAGGAQMRDPRARSMQAEMLGIAALILIRATTSSGLAQHEDNLMLFLSVLVYVVSTERALRANQAPTTVPSTTPARS